MVAMFTHRPQTRRCCSCWNSGSFCYMDMKAAGVSRGSKIQQPGSFVREARTATAASRAYVYATHGIASAVLFTTTYPANLLANRRNKRGAVPHFYCCLHTYEYAYRRSIPTRRASQCEITTVAAGVFCPNMHFPSASVS